ncbi:hypothetical protein Vretifemale_5402 [Volvox reticuliferus]|uniref:Uncharacterized protein n=1 Tax=Volvox reticuliferus TaxID=1737510 RepID=A0A8J4C6J6_9CHLO|nr:hypothetical protein Vretifemale_5402 [Volvox reticuliferus]
MRAEIATRFILIQLSASATAHLSNQPLALQGRGIIETDQIAQGHRPTIWPKYLLPHRATDRSSFQDPTCALMVYSAICFSGLRTTGGRTGIPAQAMRCSSTKSTPQTSRLVSRTGPPPMRQFTSIKRAPRLVYLDSTWNTPSLKPSACSGSGMAPS